jgi:hypothetical protein
MPEQVVAGMQLEQWAQFGCGDESTWPCKVTNENAIQVCYMIPPSIVNLNSPSP